MKHHKLKLGPETQSALQAPALFPCPTMNVAVAADPAGAGNVLVRYGGELYAPRPR